MKVKTVNKLIFKIGFPLLFIGFLYSCLADKKDKSSFYASIGTDERMEMGLKSAVKTVKTYYYSTDGDTRNPQKTNKSDAEQDAYVKFDRSGNITEEVWYDNAGHKVAQVQTQFNEARLPYRKVADYFDGSEGVIDSLFYDEEQQSKQLLKYDSQGNLLVKLVYAFDDQGNATERISYTPGEEIDQRVSYRYDSNGNRIQEEYRNKEGNKVVKRVMKYTRGCISEMKEYREEKEELTTKISIQYDEDLNKIKEEVFGAKGNLIRDAEFTYEFDDKGNWIKQIVFVFGEPELLIEREIEYY